MKYLFVDTATAHLVVAIIIEDKIEYLFNEEVGKEMSVLTLLKIKEAFEKTHLKPNDIDKIFVTVGPGSFTGIRVGLTAIKTMAWSLNIEVVPISSLEVIASHEKSIAIIDARRGYVFAGGYDENLNNIYEDRHILLKDINEDIPFVSYDNLEKCSKPNIDILKIVNKHKKEKGINPHKLNPKYLKLTEAEEKLNDRRNNG